MSRAPLRVAAMVLLLVLAFSLGYDLGQDRTPDAGLIEATPAPEPAPYGRELWESLPPELLQNVADSIEEDISDRMDDLREVQEIQQEKMSLENTG